MPPGSLNLAVDQLVEDVRTKVLGKRKFEEDDGIAVVGCREDLSCDTFAMLREGEWFNSWLLMTGMEMSDKPSFVRYGYSIAFKEPFGRKGGTRHIPEPFASWRKKIDKFRTEAQGRPGQEGGLVHFCPLNPNGNHFTLLEIDEREKKIYHYDSMASKDIIEGRVELSPMGKLVQVSYVYDHGLTRLM